MFRMDYRLTIKQPNSTCSLFEADYSGCDTLMDKIWLFNIPPTPYVFFFLVLFVPPPTQLSKRCFTLFRPIPTRPGSTRPTNVLQRCWAVAKLQFKVHLFWPPPTPNQHQQPKPTPPPFQHRRLQQALKSSCFYSDTDRGLHTYHTPLHPPPPARSQPAPPSPFRQCCSVILQWSDSRTSSLRAVHRGTRRSPPLFSSSTLYFFNVFM